MLTIAACEAKNEFDKLLDSVQREMVMIEKEGHPVAVLISMKEYKRLQKLEDTLWAAQAMKTGKESFLGVKESKKFLSQLKKKLQADDV